MVNSGTLFLFGKEKVWPQMICRQKSLKHISGQPSISVPFSHLKEN
jgi:hypothetical protein